MKIKKGVTRLVFIFPKFVIKIPRASSYINFLEGMISNVKERHYCKIFKNGPSEYRDLVIPSLFCSWFGLFQIQIRAEKELDRPLTEEEKDKFTGVCRGDLKPQNFGYWKGRLICLDYS